MVNIPLFAGFHRCWVVSRIPSINSSFTCWDRELSPRRSSSRYVVWVRRDQTRGVGGWWFENDDMSQGLNKLLVLGMVIQPLLRNAYNWYINPYYWVDDHPLLYGNTGSLDPGTHEKWECVGCGPLPITVTTRIITFLVGDSYKPSFATVTGRGPHPKNVHFLKHPYSLYLLPSWWFQMFFIFTPIRGNDDPIWLICSKWVEITN